MCGYIHYVSTILLHGLFHFVVITVFVCDHRWYGVKGMYKECAQCITYQIR